MRDWAAYVRERLRLEGLKPERAAEIVEEIAGQLEQAYREVLANGLDEAEAEAEAASHVADWEALGAAVRESPTARIPALDRLAERAAERQRRRHGLPASLAGFWSDFLYALRLLRRDRGFAAIAIATLALGIGANTAVFRVTDAALFRPLPFPHPDKLVELENLEIDTAGLSDAKIDPTHWWSAAPSIDAMAAYSSDDADLQAAGAAEQVSATLTSAEFFRVLGISPMLGRAYTAEEADSHAAVAVVGFDVWRERLGGAPSALGKTVELNGHPLEVIGVMPPGFSFPQGAQVWVPYPANALGFFSSTAFFCETVARLRSWGSLARARSDLDLAYQRILAPHPATPTFTVIPLHQALYGSSRLPLLLLLLSAGMVWLVACANLAGLMLARTTARQQELVIRAALGASPWRLMRLLWIETLALAGAAGVISVALAWGTLRALMPWVPTSVSTAAAAGDWPRVIAFVFGLTFLSTLLFGLVPAAAAAWPSLRALIEKTQGSRTATPGGQRARQVLLGAETALTLALLVAAGLLIKSFWKLSSQPEGFDPGHVLMASAPLPSAWSNQKKELFYSAAIERIGALPGVETAAAGSCLPGMGAFGIIDFSPADELSTRVGMVRCEVSTKYFQALSIPLLTGRAFTPADDQSGRNTTILNGAAAEQLWPGKAPVGRIFGFAAGKGKLLYPQEVVGVAASTRSWGFADPAFPSLYVPYGRGTMGRLFLLARTSVPPEALASALRGAVWSVDKSVPVTGIETLDQAMAKSISAEHFRAWLSGAFAALALALACVGIFGVVSYDVSRRTREIGIRMALGARGRQVTGMMLRRGMLGVWIGAAVGLGGAFALARWLASLLFQMQPLDPEVFAGAALLVLLAGGTAAWLPARRATKIDPSSALRYE